MGQAVLVFSEFPFKRMRPKKKEKRKKEETITAFPAPPTNASTLASSEVIWMSKDVTEVGNDRFLVTVPILDHDGSLRCGFPVENRLLPIQTTEDLADAVKNAGGGEAYAERLRDFHLLLFLAKHLDLNDLGVIASAAREGTEIQEGYKLIIDSIAGLA